MNPEDEKPASVSNEQLLSMVKALQDKNTALETKLGDKVTREENQVDYYHCNACGKRLKKGERCPDHPREQVVGMGIVFNPRTNSVRTGSVSRS